MAQIVLVYTTTHLSSTDHQSLYQELNNPHRLSSAGSLVSFTSADANVVGGDLETVLQAHRGSRHAGNAGIDQSLIVVADDGVSPSSHPQAVLLVKIIAQSDESSAGGHQAIRVLASNAAEVLTTIASGQHSWEEYWKVAQANGGHFPGE